MFWKKYFTVYSRLYEFLFLQHFSNHTQIIKNNFAVTNFAVSNTKEILQANSFFSIKVEF